MWPPNTYQTWSLSIASTTWRWDKAEVTISCCKRRTPPSRVWWGPQNRKASAELTEGWKPDLRRALHSDCLARVRKGHDTTVQDRGARKARSLGWEIQRLKRNTLSTDASLGECYGSRLKFLEWTIEPLAPATDSEKQSCQRHSKQQSHISTKHACVQAECGRGVAFVPRCILVLLLYIHVFSCQSTLNLFQSILNPLTHS